MTRERFGQVMATLAVALPGKEPTAALLDVYWATLADLTDAQLERAGKAALRTCKFFPTPSELLAFACPPRNLEAEAGRIFERVKELADYSPRVGSVWSETKIRLALGDAVADAFQAAGGASGFQRGDDIWTRKAFVDAYRAHPPEEVPVLRLPKKSKTAALLPGDARVLDLTARIGRSIPGDDREAKRAAYIDRVTEREP